MCNHVVHMCVCVRVFISDQAPSSIASPVVKRQVTAVYMRFVALSSIYTALLFDTNKYICIYTFAYMYFVYFGC